MTQQLLLFVAVLFSLSYCQAPAPAPKKTAPENKVVTTSPQIQRTQPQPLTDELTVDKVVKLIQNDLAEDLIITQIRKNGKAFDLSTEQILQLKKAGASNNVIRAMMDPQAQPITTSEVPSPPPAAPPGTVFKGTLVSQGQQGQASTAAPASSAGQTRATTEAGSAPAQQTTSKVAVQRRILITSKRFQSDEADFPDKTLLDSVTDLKGAATGRGFTVTDNETDARLMLTVLERKTEQVRPSFMAHKTPRVEGILNCALWYKEGNDWKPAVKLRTQSRYWKDAATKMMGEVDKWLNK